MTSLFERYDLLACPVTSVPAFPIEDGPPNSVSGVTIDPLLDWLLTYPFNLTGQPAASVPCLVTGESPPMGLQVVGRRMDEARTALLSSV
jgi:Asp-tRNA(Asn)/Glu-tRNA(Gln) amidotransferase A subunit family amidase